MAQAKQHSTPKKRPTKRGSAKVPKHGTATFRSDDADPIFKLIEDWKAAEKGFSKAVSHVAACEKRGLPEDGTEMLAAETALEEADDVASDALRKVCDTPPQTLIGLTALVKAMRPDYERDEGFLDWNDGRTLNLFASLETALVGLDDSADPRCT